VGSGKDDARREFLQENQEPVDLHGVSTRELLEELRTRLAVTAYDVPAEGIHNIIIHSSRRIMDRSSLLVAEEDAGPATILKINVKTKNLTSPLRARIAAAIEEELYLPLKAEIDRTPYTSRLGFLKERLKMKIEEILAIEAV